MEPGGVKKGRCPSPDITDCVVVAQKRVIKAKDKDKDKRSSSPSTITTVPVDDEAASLSILAQMDDGGVVRRSSRIKSLEGQKGRGRRREVVFSSRSSSTDSNLSKSLPNINQNDDDSNSCQDGFNISGGQSPSDSLPAGVSSIRLSPTSGSPGIKSEDGGNSRPFKVKSRWRNSADAESKSLSTESLPTGLTTCSVETTNTPEQPSTTPVEDVFVPSKDLIKKSGHLLYNKYDTELVDKLKKFQGIEDSIFRKERKISKESKGMVCDCFLTADEIARGENGCVEDCLNRLLMVECGSICPTGESCVNRKFQRKQYASLEVFKTDKKGHGLRALQSISEGAFVIEYVGEILDPFQFENRTKDYAKGNQEHFYFMALKADSIIDATMKGNCSRFINHSCEPNCETQKWTVNGELRIGFFTLRDLKPGEEIVFDYQFQRYGKKAQRCYCGTPSCRGWIGEEDEVEDDDKELDATDAPSPEDYEAEAAELAEKKRLKKIAAAQRKIAAAERKKKRDAAVRMLEDLALQEELSQLERSGLKNRSHTLSLSRLMVRAEKWEDRERILNILINGDSPCRRLFLDYRGLKLMYNWMVNLVLPVEDSMEQSITSEECHLLFLKALKSLSIPNKTMLLDSKVLALMETWSSVPEKTPLPMDPQPTPILDTPTTPILEDKEIPAITMEMEVAPEVDASLIPAVEIKEELVPESEIKMEVDSEDTLIIKPSSPLLEIVVQPEPEQKYAFWTFKNIAAILVASWTDLKEVFRIPKKERVEQMKEHEREADKGSPSLPAKDLVPTSNYSYDRDGRSKYGSNRNGRGDRRVSVLDSYAIHRQQQRQVKDLYPHLSKEQKREMFAARVKQEEEDTKQRRMQDDMIVMHQHRCCALGLDPSTTPVVDISGHYYLDPARIEWKRIIPHDPSLPAGIQQMLNAAKAKENIPPQPQTDSPDDYVFPPWPEGLPAPPPLPPSTLPDGWKMAVDDEGRCYYYHIRTQQTQWTPPTLEDCQIVAMESSESSDSLDDDVDTLSDDVKELIVSTNKSIPTLRTRLFDRAERRKKTGLVQERIISPRTEEDKSTISKAVIRARKLEVLEEKRQKAVDAARADIGDEEDLLKDEVAEEEEAGTTTVKGSGEQTTEIKEVTKTLSPKSTPEAATTATETILSTSGDDDDDDSDEVHGSSSPIETELDISLASISDDHYGSPPPPSESAVIIPGLGFDPRDLVLNPPSASTSSSSAPTKSQKKDRGSKHERKHKTAAYKKVSADKSKEAFRNQIANVVVTHLNPYKKQDCKTGRITKTEDFKHLARKMTHAIFLKELKHSREGRPLEVTEGVKQKTKEYIKKFMGRFGSSNYIPSPDESESQK